jgi:hypothetical protein
MKKKMMLATAVAAAILTSSAFAQVVAISPKNLYPALSSLTALSNITIPVQVTSGMTADDVLSGANLKAVKPVVAKQEMFTVATFVPADGADLAVCILGMPAENRVQPLTCQGIGS